MLKVLLATALLSTVAPAQAAPKVVQLGPSHLDGEVQAAKVTHLLVRFDQPMQPKGFSLCGGGPKFPKVTGQPRWKDDRTCIVPVRLQPGRSYYLSVNCAKSQNFRSQKGVPAQAKLWTFCTLPNKLPDRGQQLASNKQAWSRLQTVLTNNYSYFEHRRLNWKKVFTEHAQSILNSKTDIGWVTAASRMLQATNDLHLYLRFGDYTVQSGQGSPDPLFRKQYLGKYLKKLTMPTRRVLKGHTADNIGYLLIDTWTKQVDFDEVEELLRESKSHDALVLDVRTNGGGNELFARRVAAWFVRGNKVYAKHTTRTGPGKDGFSPPQERHIRGNRQPRMRFEKPVAVLMGPRCMSSCEAFLLMMKQAENCKLVGQTSRGSSGNPKKYPLGNGVVAFVPSWKALRADGSCFEGEGIVPDERVACDAAAFRKTDPILERALHGLRKQLRATNKKR